MNYWLMFWAFALVVAGASFAAITLIVIFRGYHDLRNMFTGLTKQGIRNE